MGTILESKDTHIFCRKKFKLFKIFQKGSKTFWACQFPKTVLTLSSLNGKKTSPGNNI